MGETVITFAVTLLATFGCILVVATLINFCKRRQSRTAHGLTGMCHKSGGAMCGSCSSQLRAGGNWQQPQNTQEPESSNKQ